MFPRAVLRHHVRVLDAFTSKTFVGDGHSCKSNASVVWRFPAREL